MENTNYRGYNYYQEAQDQLNGIEIILIKINARGKENFYPKYLGWLRQTRFSSKPEN